MIRISCAIVCPNRMEEISYSSSNSRLPIRKKISKRLALFGIFFVIIILLLGGLFYFVTQGNSKKEVIKTITLPPTEQSKEGTPTPTPEVTSIPTPSPTKSQSSEKSAIKVTVQNGSGESGVAGKASAILKTAGYNVVSSGNADAFDYTDVTIKVKNSRKQILISLKTDLSKDYTIGATSTDLPEATAYDALVIIGK